MSKLLTILSDLEKQLSRPQEGDAIDIIINEELAVRTDIVAIENNNIHIGVDSKAFKVLNAAGLIKEIE